MLRPSSAGVSFLAADLLHAEVELREPCGGTPALSSASQPHDSRGKLAINRGIKFLDDHQGLAWGLQMSHAN